MPNRPVPAAATGLPKAKSDELFDILFNMEDAVRSYMRWAEAIRTYGLSTESCPPGALYAIGCAMETEAEIVIEDWERCWNIARAERRDDR